MRRMYSLEQLKKVAQEVASSGELNNVKIFEEIVDNDGHKRFVEGDINIKSIEGVTKSYGKWSLSGTHLMLVLVLQLANNLSLNSGNVLTENINLPSWVKEKIMTIVGASVAFSNDSAWASNYTSQQLPTRLVKSQDDIYYEVYSPLTLTADRIVRIEYDLLIDNE